MEKDFLQAMINEHGGISKRGVLTKVAKAISKSRQYVHQEVHRYGIGNKNQEQEKVQEINENS